MTDFNTIELAVNKKMGKWYTRILMVLLGSIISINAFTISAKAESLDAEEVVDIVDFGYEGDPYDEDYSVDLEAPEEVLSDAEDVLPEEPEYIDEAENAEEAVEAAEEAEEPESLDEEFTVYPDIPQRAEFINNFVIRMYKEVLDRNPEYSGRQDWGCKLYDKEIDGATVARGFILSQEFKERNLSNEDYVDVLYSTFFDREADPAGREYWINALNNDTSREKVLAGFVNSGEFSDICTRYYIERGTMENDGSVTYYAGVGDYVDRCYEKILGRKADNNGKNYWTHYVTSRDKDAPDPQLDPAWKYDEALARKNAVGRGARELAKTFFNSEEYLNKNSSDSEYVDTLYNCLFDREADEAGKAHWMNELKSGKSRNEILDEFASSGEYTSVIHGYISSPAKGVIVGSSYMSSCHKGNTLEDLMRMEREIGGLIPYATERDFPSIPIGSVDNHRMTIYNTISQYACKEYKKSIGLPENAIVSMPIDWYYDVFMAKVGHMTLAEFYKEYAPKYYPTYMKELEEYYRKRNNK